MNASKRPPVDTRRRANSSVGPGSRRAAHEVWVWLVPMLTALALYARTLGFAFVWDDFDLIVRNAALQGPDWTALLAQDFWQSTGGGTGMWRPLVTLSYRIDGVLGGWQPWNFHAVNLLLHAVSAALVARLARARGLRAPAALAAGVVFATAPALCEPVAWIAGRTDGIVVLATLLVLLAAARWRESGARLALVAAGLGTALALLAKETALVLPLLLAADAADARARTPLAAPRAWLPVLVSGLVVAGWAMAHRALVSAPGHAGDPGAALGMAALLWAHLAWLTPFVAHVPLLEVWTPPATPLALIAWLGLAVVAAGAFVLARRRRAVLLVLALVVLPLVPVVAASLVESGVRFAERSLALPAVGLALGLAALTEALPWRRVAWAGLALWTVAQLVVTVPLVGAWRDDEARIRRVVAVRPRDPDALLGLADLLSSMGRTSEASELIARAQAVAPSDDASAWVARASTEFTAGRLEPALAAAEQALARDRGSLAAGVIRVRALARLARTAEAVAAGEALHGEQPAAPAAAGALGVARLAAGDAAAAQALLAPASAQLLEDAGLAWDLGRAAIATGDVALARTAFERAVRASPDFYEAWLGVADTRERLGDRAGAEQALARAEALPGARDGRAAVLRARIDAH